MSSLAGVKKIGLVSSVPEEGSRLINLLPTKSTIGGKPFSRGRFAGKQIVYVVSGMGKTNAAHAATLLIEKFSLDLVILFGVGGAYPASGLRIGDIAVAVKEVYGDEGVLTKDGFRGTEAIGIPFLKKKGKSYFNEFPLDKRLVQDLLGIIPPCPPLEKGGRGNFQIRSGIFVTVSTCTGTRKRAIELEKRFGALCENMEGAAIAHICALYGTPVAEMRGISNIVEDRNRRKWDIPLAAGNCQSLVMEVLKSL